MSYFASLEKKYWGRRRYKIYKVRDAIGGGRYIYMHIYINLNVFLLICDHYDPTTWQGPTEVHARVYSLHSTAGYRSSLHLR